MSVVNGGRLTGASVDKVVGESAGRLTVGMCRWGEGPKDMIAKINVRWGVVMKGDGLWVTLQH